MAKSDSSPSLALALATLAELGQSARQQGAARAARPEAPEAAHIVAAAGAHEALRAQVRAAERTATAAARALAQGNQQRAELLLRRGKLQARMDELRRAQAQASSDELARRLRRARAELGVDAQAMDAQLQSLQGNVDAARAALAAAQADGAQGELEARNAAARLQALQRAAEPLAAGFAACGRGLMQAHCRLFVAGHSAGGPAGADVAAWREAVLAQGRALRVLHAGMVEGRYAKDDVDGYAGGRSFVTGEAICASIAAGALDEAAATFAACCPEDQFFHQIFPVYRAYSFGALAAGKHAQVLAAARLHRFAEGLRGSLAEASWCLLRRDQAGFARALLAVCRDDWRTWSHTGQPAMGLVSTTTCALARLGRAHNLALPASLGPTAPPALWAAPP